MAEADRGILSLKTDVPRDAGNPAIGPFPVRYAVVAPTTVGRLGSAEPPVHNDVSLVTWLRGGRAPRAWGKG